MKCRCLGLDNSRYCTGWCIIDIDTETNNKEYREGMRIIDYGYIDTHMIKQEGDVLLYMEEQFTKIFDLYNPDVIAAEQLFIGRNAQTGIVLAGIHAIMKLCAASYKVPITYYTIMTMKAQTLVDMKLKKDNGERKKGNELKQEVAQAVFDLFDNVQFRNITDDVTDAISAVITYVRLDGQGVGKQSANVKQTGTKKKTVSTKKTSAKKTSTKKETTKKNSVEKETTRKDTAKKTTKKKESSKKESSKKASITDKKTTTKKK